MNQMPISLVTGAGGFMGSEVAQHLIAKGHKVVVLDDLRRGFRENIPDEAIFVHGPITDQRLVDRLFERHSFDYVYHLAAYDAEGLSHFVKRFNYTNNLIGSVNLINAAVNSDVKCFVYTSSIAVYGAGQRPMSEDMIPVPEDPYGIAKLAVEQELRVLHKMFDLDYVIFRPRNVYGERQNIGDRYCNVVGIFMNQLLRGQPMTILGDGNRQHSFTYIHDIVSIVADSVEYPAARGQVFNIGADVPYTVNEFAEFVAEATGRPSGIVHFDARNEVKPAFSDHSKAERVFRIEQRISLPEGVRAMADWVQAHGARKPASLRTSRLRKICRPVGCDHPSPGIPPPWTNPMRQRHPLQRIGLRHDACRH